MNKLTYIQGAVVLAVSNLFVGILAFGFRIFFSRNTSAEGMGVYQLVLPLYMLLITLVSGGVITAISKLVAESKAKNNIKAVQKTIKVSLVMISLWSLLLCSVIMLNAEWIATQLLKDERTILPIMVCVPSVFFISIAAIFKGYFYGLQDIKLPALIDVLEKIIRLVVLIIITKLTLPYGIEFVCAGAMLSMTLGELVSLFLLNFAYNRKRLCHYEDKRTDSSLSIISKIIRLAVPLSFAGALATIMDMISAVLVPSQLRMAGYNASEALAVFGKLTGMVTPLIIFPGIVIYALTITLVPAITKSHVKKNYGALNKKCNDSLTIAWSIGLLATVLCTSFPHELCEVFFKSAEAGDLLFWMGLGCTFQYLHFIQFAILNGLGLQRKVLTSILIEIVITVACIY
ncbi:MAG: oligosaccharide flippase family protein, partial [Clostridia bacterium]|nr:oligosaccharide flippase family protein [Clostridia bacterium]